MRVVGYVRVSRRRKGREQDPYTIEMQRRTIETWAALNGHELVGVESEVVSGKSTRREGLQRVMATMRGGGADLLVSAKLDRLSRSALDFAQLVKQAREEGWAIAVLDIGVDTSTPNGRLVAGMLAQVAEWERELISLRTKEALEQARLEGVRLGRPASLPVDVVATIKRRRRAGWSFARIADRLNDDGVPTAHGGQRWHRATVRSVALRSA